MQPAYLTPNPQWRMRVCVERMDAEGNRERCSLASMGIRKMYAGQTSRINSAPINLLENMVFAPELKLGSRLNRSTFALILSHPLEDMDYRRVLEFKNSSLLVTSYLGYSDVEDAEQESLRTDDMMTDQFVACEVWIPLVHVLHPASYGGGLIHSTKASKLSPQNSRHSPMFAEMSQAIWMTYLELPIIWGQTFFMQGTSATDLPERMQKVGELMEEFVTCAVESGHSSIVELVHRMRSGTPPMTAIPAESINNKFISDLVLSFSETVTGMVAEEVAANGSSASEGGDDEAKAVVARLEGLVAEIRKVWGRGADDDQPPDLISEMSYPFAVVDIDYRKVPPVRDPAWSFEQQIASPLTHNQGWMDTRCSVDWANDKTFWDFMKDTALLSKGPLLEDEDVKGGNGDEHSKTVSPEGAELMRKLQPTIHYSPQRVTTLVGPDAKWVHSITSSFMVTPTDPTYGCVKKLHFEVEFDGSVGPRGKCCFDIPWRKLARAEGIVDAATGITIDQAAIRPSARKAGDSARAPYEISTVFDSDDEGGEQWECTVRAIPLVFYLPLHQHSLFDQDDVLHSIAHRMAKLMEKDGLGVAAEQQQEQDPAEDGGMGEAMKSMTMYIMQGLLLTATYAPVLYTKSPQKYYTMETGRDNLLHAMRYQPHSPLVVVPEGMSLADV